MEKMIVEFNQIESSYLQNNYIEDAKCCFTDCLREPRFVVDIQPRFPLTIGTKLRMCVTHYAGAIIEDGK